VCKCNALRRRSAGLAQGRPACAPRGRACQQLPVVPARRAWPLPCHARPRPLCRACVGQRRPACTRSSSVDGDRVEEPRHLRSRERSSPRERSRPRSPPLRRGRLPVRSVRELGEDAAIRERPVGLTPKATELTQVRVRPDDERAPRIRQNIPFGH